MGMFNTASAFSGLGKASLKLDFETKEELNEYCARMLEASNPDGDGDEPEGGDRYLLHSVKGLNAPGDVYLITDTRSKAKKELDEIKALQKYDVQKFNKEALKDIEEGDPLLYEQLKSDFNTPATAQQTLPASTSPLMKQYNVIKQKYPDAVLLFNVRSYYEAFGDDAKKIADVLGISLTSREGQYLAGFKVRDLEKNLKKLIRAGIKVAVCEQTEQALGAVNYYVKAYYPGLGKAGDIYVVRDMRTRSRKEPGELLANKNLNFVRVPAEGLKNFNRKIWDLQKGDSILSDLKKEGYITIHLHLEENKDKYFVNIPFYVPYKKEKYDVPTLAGRWRDVPVEVDIKKVYNIAPAQHTNAYLTDYEKRQHSGEYTDYVKRNDFYGVITLDYYEELRKKAYQQLKKEILESNSRYITDYQKKLFTDFYKDPKKFKIRLLYYYNDKESHALDDNQRDEYIGFEGSKSANPLLYNNLDILETNGYRPTYQILPSYDKLFAPSEHKTSFAGFGLDDTKKLIADICRKHYKECAAIAQYLKGDNLKQSCFNLWHWLHNNIRYEYDREGREEVRTPLRVWADRRRGVDCDCLSVFAWCVLKCMGYDPAFELVAFNNKKQFSHIFVNCNGVVVDRVWWIFNQRPPNVTSSELYKVNLLSNLGQLF